MPRQWWMFSGHITKEVGYFVSIAQGFDTLNGLDMFVDFNYDRRLQFRVGRFKTPFTYEFFVDPIQGLITPERSLFFNNFGQNRDLGIMAYGQLFNGPNFDQASKFQYAAGIFNGSRNGFVSNQDRESLLRIHEFPSVRRLDGFPAGELQFRRIGVRGQQCPGVGAGHVSNRTGYERQREFRDPFHVTQQHVPRSRGRWPSGTCTSPISTSNSR